MRPLIWLLFLLASCTSASQPNQNTVSRATLTACQAYSAALRTLAAYNQAGKLAPDQVASVDRARAILNAACAEPPSQATLDRITAELTVLLVMESTASREN